ncbi:MAG TPA: hypothetical protein VNT55_11370 [Baekduia sp.]|nr:hypothetical protein [Baekduia sp.]
MRTILLRGRAHAPGTLLAIVLTVMASVTLAPAAGASAKRGTFSGTLGVKVGKGAGGAVRAVSLADLTVVAGKDVSRSGAFSLSLPAGSYLVVGTVTGTHAKPVRKQLGLSLKAGQKRTKAKLTAKLKPKAKKKGKAAYLTQGGSSAPGSTAVGINPFDGPSSGDLQNFARGAADMVIVDLVNGLPKACASSGGDVVVREVDPERVKALEAEQELGRSPYADKSTFPPPNVIVPDVLVNGTVDRDGNVTATINDARTGEVIDQVTQELGSDAFDGLEQLAGKLADKLCSLTDAYELRLDVNGRGEFGTHSATGKLSTTLIARGADGHWEGGARLQWTDIAFTPEIKCPILNPVSIGTDWKATVTQSAPDQITVSWSLVGSDIATGTIDCPADGSSFDPPPIAGVPATSVINAGPASFTLPLSGGSQTISGGVTSGAGGFSNDGTLVVRPTTTKR